MNENNVDIQPISKKTFAELLETMPEGRGINVGKRSDANINIFMVNEEDLRKIADDPFLLHLIFLFQRPGVHYFANYLEHVHFIPETPANDEFEYRIYKWEGFLWGIITIPIIKKHLAEEVAAKAKLRLANGVPMISKGLVKAMMSYRPGSELDEQQVNIFPMATEQVFALENIKGDVLYDGPGGSQDAKISENFKIRKLWDECGIRSDDGINDEPDPWKE